MQAERNLTGATYDDNGNLIPPLRVLNECPEKYAGPRHPQGSYLYKCLTEALEEHWKDCCTEQDPCELAAFQILATSRHGRLATATPHGDTDDPEPGSGSGKGHGRPRNGTLATEPQVQLMNRLAGELTCAAPQGSAAYILGELAFDLLDGTFDGDDFLLTAQRASRTIDGLLAESKKLRDQRRQERRSKEGEAARKLEDDAVYLYDGAYYRACRTQDGARLYAKKLTLGQDEDGATTVTADYAPGVIARLTPQMKLTLEEAQRFGKAHGVCCQCWRKLTRRESIERGIGPICAEKF